MIGGKCGGRSAFLELPKSHAVAKLIEDVIQVRDLIDPLLVLQMLNAFRPVTVKLVGYGLNGVDKLEHRTDASGLRKSELLSLFIRLLPSAEPGGYICVVGGAFQPLPSVENLDLLCSVARSDPSAQNPKHISRMSLIVDPRTVVVVDAVENVVYGLCKIPALFLRLFYW